MKFIPLTAALLCAATTSLSQHAHGSGGPAETGQSQFAAIAEIVTLLRNDPTTDWTKVDIDALRAHLVDMDRVTTRATATETVKGLGVTYAVTGDAATAPSIKRMALAHSPMLQQTSGWTVQATETDRGATMTVEVTSQAALDQVTGLGFFGLMTIGAHHQSHHMMIAKGGSPH